MIKKRNIPYVQFLFLALTLLLPFFCKAGESSVTGTWLSKATGEELSFKVTHSSSPVRDVNGNYFTVVYLENLHVLKIGGNTNETDVAWLLENGYRVIELDYSNHDKASNPAINSDIVAINNAIAAGTFCGQRNCSLYRSYILFEGYRILRNVSFFKDDPTVYNTPDGYTQGDSLYMDIIYPANASEKVPVVLSFSYSNSYAANKHQRLSLGNTLAGFNDSFQEGAPACGVAWAIADHPKYCPWGGGKPTGGANDTYKSYQVNPDAARKVRSAVRTLRVVGEELGLSGEIGVYGFSRGSDAASMAIGDRQEPEIDTVGRFVGTLHNVQVAALGPGVFDFTQIYKRTNDGDENLETRCPWAWGSLESNYDVWKKMGAEYLVQSSETAPTLFFYNTSDNFYYKDQSRRFQYKLDTLGVSTSSLIDYGYGHSVPQIAEDLNVLYTFFTTYLNPPVVYMEPTVTKKVITGESIQMELTPNPAIDRVEVSLTLTELGNVQIELLDISGKTTYTSQHTINFIGKQTLGVSLNTMDTTKGVCFVKVSTPSACCINRLVIL